MALQSQHNIVNQRNSFDSSLVGTDVELGNVAGVDRIGVDSVPYSADMKP